MRWCVRKQSLKMMEKNLALGTLYIASHLLANLESFQVFHKLLKTIVEVEFEKKSRRTCWLKYWYEPILNKFIEIRPEVTEMKSLKINIFEKRKVISIIEIDSMRPVAIAVEP